MEKSSFTELFPQLVECLCNDICRVYHLSQEEAIKTLLKTHFYSFLSDENSSLWELDPATLFSLYQDEIEYGKLIHFS